MTHPIPLPVLIIAICLFAALVAATFGGLLAWFDNDDEGKD